jgi:hypothetical protein
MNSIEMINRLPPSSAGHTWSAGSSVRASGGALPTAGQRFDEILPLVDLLPQVGPPLVFVLGPWLVVVLMLIGPLVLLFTLMIATVLLGAVAAATFALPYLLVRRLRKRWPHRPARHLSRRRLRGPLKTGLYPHSSTDVTPHGM